MKGRYDRGDIRRLNAVSALDQLRRHGALSRAQIAERLGLTRATVSNIVSDLLEVSLIQEKEYAVGGVGRRGLLLDLNPGCGAMVAVELDIDRISVALADGGMRILWRGETGLEMGVAAEEGLGRAERLVKEALRRGNASGLSCLGIGVAWAGLVKAESGELAYGPSTGWEGVALGSVWEKKFGVPVYVENEAHAGAIAAHHFGEPRLEENVIYLSLGVGLSAGVFVGGELLRGADGFAGQVGHVPFVAEGHACSCGRRGCWVSEIGVAGLARKLASAGIDLDLGDGEVLGDLGWLDAVCEAARKGDERVRLVLNEQGRQIGEGLASLVQAFNPSRVVIGGHLRQVSALCENRIGEALRERVLSPMGRGLTVEVSRTGDDQIVGCLATVFDAVMRNPMRGGAAR